jgi:hypothetical protein
MIALACLIRMQREDVIKAVWDRLSALVPY